MVYGSPYHEHKWEFIAELHDVMENSTIPTLVCGDFNLVRCAKEKSSERIDPQMTFLFNDWINKWMLMEFKLSNRLYSWVNNQKTLFKLPWIGCLFLLIGNKNFHSLLFKLCLHQ
jgi:hypothetical protein